MILSAYVLDEQFLQIKFHFLGHISIFICQIHALRKCTIKAAQRTFVHKY